MLWASFQLAQHAVVPGASEEIFQHPRAGMAGKSRCSKRGWGRKGRFQTKNVASHVYSLWVKT